MSTRPLFVLLVIVLITLLTSCNAAATTISIPTSSSTLAAALTPTGRPSATPPPRPTLPPRPVVLDIFPVKLDATWVYSTTLDYNENGTDIHWTGLVTETITTAHQENDAWIFRAEILGHPLRNAQRGNQIKYYTAIENRLYEFYGDLPERAAQIARRNGEGGAVELELPLEVGRQWGEPQFLKRGDGLYIWRVESRESVNTPAGTWEDCYRLLFVTNPDDTTLWFCPKIGVARYQYHHHGSLLNEASLLQAFHAPD